MKKYNNAFIATTLLFAVSINTINYAHASDNNSYMNDTNICFADSYKQYFDFDNYLNNFNGLSLWLKDNYGHISSQTSIYLLPFLAQITRAYGEHKIVNHAGNLMGNSQKMKVFSKFLTAIICDLGVIGVTEPAIARLQSLLQKEIYSGIGVTDEAGVKTQEKLGERVTELSGRLSPESQMSRANFDQMVPLISQALSNAQVIIERDTENHQQAIALIAFAAKTIRLLHPEFEIDDKLIASLAKTYMGKGFGNLKNLDEFRLNTLAKIKEMDPVASEYKEVLQDYMDMIAGWDLVCLDKDNCKGKNKIASSSLMGINFKTLAKDTGFYAIGLSGYLLPAVLKTLVHDSHVIIKVLTTFAANQLYYGITDPHSIMLYSNTQRWMLSHGVNYENEADRKNTDKTNQKYINSLRRAKSLLSKQAQASRQIIVICLSSIVKDLSDAHAALLNGDEENSLQLLANTAVYLKTEYPEFEANNRFINETVHVFFSDFAKLSENFKDKLLQKISEIDPNYNNSKDSQEKYQNMLNAWGIN